MSLGRHGLPLEEQLDLDRLYDEAFEPGRSRRAPISAARVRARVAWDRPQPASAGWRSVALLGRLSESSLALGMTVILFVGALGGVTGQTETVPPEQRSELVVRVSAPMDETRFFRLLRLGRSAPVADNVHPVDEMRLLRLGRSAPVADNVDPATALPAVIAEEGEPSAGVRERQGLLR